MSMWDNEPVGDCVAEQRVRAEKAEAERDRLANQLINEVPGTYLQMKARALAAEAAIARVRELCERARVSMSIGCRCEVLVAGFDEETDECSGTCGNGTPLSWTLDPNEVLRAMDGDGDD